MFKELLYIDYEDIVNYIEDEITINKIKDILKHINFFYSNNLLNITPEESDFNTNVENIIAYEDYTSSDKRTELLYLIIEESIECLNLMGIKINDTIKVTLTDVYNITFKLYNLVNDKTVDEILEDDTDELIEDLFGYDESDGTDYSEVVIDITSYFIYNFNKYKKSVVKDHLEDNFNIENKINLLVSKDPSYFTCKPISDYLLNGKLEEDSETYLSNLIKDNDSIGKLKLDLSAFVLLYYSKEVYYTKKNNLIRLLTLCNVETMDIDMIMNYIESIIEG